MLLSLIDAFAFFVILVEVRDVFRGLGLLSNPGFLPSESAPSQMAQPNLNWPQDHQ